MTELLARDGSLLSGCVIFAPPSTEKLFSEDSSSRSTIRCIGNKQYHLKTSCGRYLHPLTLVKPETLTCGSPSPRLRMVILTVHPNLSTSGFHKFVSTSSFSELPCGSVLSFLFKKASFPAI